MSTRTLILASIWLVLVTISFTLHDIRDQMRRWEIVVESSGDAAAVLSGPVSNTGDDR